jgi:hypothetical protein
MPIKEINCDEKIRKAIASLAIILSWKIRKERNGRFFSTPIRYRYRYYQNARCED